jgi:hypothetical protein
MRPSNTASGGIYSQIPMNQTIIAIIKDLALSSSVLKRAKLTLIVQNYPIKPI